MNVSELASMIWPARSIFASKEREYMSKTPLTDAMKDSHRITLSLHVEAGDRAYAEGNWSGAITAYQLALPHANALHEKDVKKLVFGMLNRARAKFKLEARNHAAREEIETTDVAA